MRSELAPALLFALLAPGCIFSTYNPLFSDGEGGACLSEQLQGKVLVDGQAFDDLAEAVEAAADGGTVEVCPGEHTANLTVAKSLSLVGRGGRDNVVLVGAGGDINPGSVVYMESGGLSISGLTIRGGHGTEFQGGEVLGGGVMAGYASALSIENCIIENNTAGSGFTPGFGAGVFGPLEPEGEVVIRGSVLRDNEARNAGGALYLIDGEVIETELFRNTAAYGGGLAVDSGDVTLTNSSVLANTAEEDEGGGGAIVTAGVLRSEISDWGANEKNNVEGDIMLQDASGLLTWTYYDFTDAETFVCDANLLECE